MCLFFFSSRRRHTRYWRDWSSDVCSSDLYRCTGTEKNRFGGQRRCDARPILGERLDTAVWTEVCRLLADPARGTEEYQRRLRAVRTGPRRPELETVERQLAKLRGGVGRPPDRQLCRRGDRQGRVRAAARRIAPARRQAGGRVRGAPGRRRAGPLPPAR